MKRESILLFLLTSVMVNLFAQNKDVKPINPVKNVIKIDLAEIFSQALSIQYERMITKNISVSLGIIGKYTSASAGFSTIGSLSKTTSGLGIMPEFRFYAIPNYYAPRGLYLSASHQYYKETFEEKVNAYDANSNIIEATGSYSTVYNSTGVSIGWVFRIKSSFTIDLGLGAAFENVSVPRFYEYKTTAGQSIEKMPTNQTKTTALTPIGRIAIGYAF